MPPTMSALVSVLGALLSGVIGGLTVWVSIRKRSEEESLGRATRRTAALQLLSDEECTLEQVRDECVVMNTLLNVRPNKLHQEHLLAESQRILAEASEMLTEVRSRRKNVQEVIASMPALELEAVIAKAYHGKRRAESQLRRTQLSRTEVLAAYRSADGV